MKILVASNSQIKLNAVKSAFVGGVSPKVFGRGSRSMVNEQPVGIEEALRGAVNRMNQISVVPDYDYYVAMENGIEEVGPTWMDFAMVIVANKSGIRYIAKSAGVVFPSLYVLEAQRRGFETTTVGMIVAERLGGNDADPHYTLTGIRREEILTQAVNIALGQILNESIR